MTDRIHCIVPFCPRTTRRYRAPTERICAEHWRLTDRLARRVYARRLRSFGYRSEAERAQYVAAMWNVLKRQAIERAAGIA